MWDQSSKTQLNPGWTNPLLGCRLFQFCCSSSHRSRTLTVRVAVAQLVLLPLSVAFLRLPGSCCAQVPLSVPAAWLMHSGGEQFPFRGFATLLLTAVPSCRQGQGAAAVTAQPRAWLAPVPVWEPLFTLQRSPTTPAWPWAAGSFCDRLYKWWDKCFRGLNPVELPEMMVTCQGEPGLSSLWGPAQRERIEMENKGSKASLPCPDGACDKAVPLSPLTCVLLSRSVKFLPMAICGPGPMSIIVQVWCLC